MHCNWICSICFLWLTLFFTVKVNGQSLKELHVIDGPMDFIRVDNFGKIYVADQNEIRLYSAKGALLARNSNKFYGSISDIDASNGLEVMVFFKDLSKIVFVDNQLAEKGKELALDEMGLDQVTLTCTSHGQGVWLFDQTRTELIRLDQDGRFSHRTGNLTQLLGHRLQPEFMREVDNWVYMADPNIGILVFDIYGAYYKTIPVKPVRYFQVKSNQLLFTQPPIYGSFDMKELKIDTVFDVPVESQAVFMTKNQINIQENSRLTLFEYQP